ncbi:unnamed protein product [Cyprideis torosa]|uniref:Uncharacterized protein n=1 Tax=Cyprideis torosa TaxID=163714 RepID=A0A7R8ZNP1_9CRUS|nr:unnamed protein product [Cyprideis torosa]CAG0896792.1 unnamed protein product [Cyprideis torosa]
MSETIARSRIFTMIGVSEASVIGSEATVLNKIETALKSVRAKELLAQAGNGNLLRCRELMKMKTPYITDQFGNTVLHAAVESGNIQLVELFLCRGCNVGVRNKMEKTALHISATLGQLKMTEFLLKNAAEVNAQDVLLMTPLHWAVENSHWDVVQLLLEANADATIRSKFGQTAEALIHSRSPTGLKRLGANLSGSYTMDSNSNAVITVTTNTRQNKSPSNRSFAAEAETRRPTVTLRPRPSAIVVKGLVPANDPLVKVASRVLSPLGLNKTVPPAQSSTRSIDTSTVPTAKRKKQTPHNVPTPVALSTEIFAQIDGEGNVRGSSPQRITQWWGFSPRGFIDLRGLVMHSQVECGRGSSPRDVVSPSPHPNLCGCIDSGGLHLDALVRATVGNWDLSNVDDAMLQDTAEMLSSETKPN